MRAHLARWLRSVTISLALMGVLITWGLVALAVANGLAPPTALKPFNDLFKRKEPT